MTVRHSTHHTASCDFKVTIREPSQSRDRKGAIRAKVGLGELALAWTRLEPYPTRLR